MTHIITSLCLRDLLVDVCQSNASFPVNSRRMVWYCRSRHDDYGLPPECPFSDFPEDEVLLQSKGR
jgi:hypothetical protein